MALISKKVFIAPSIMVAFVDRAHPKHEQASAFFRYFAQEEYLLFTDTPSMMASYEQIYREISPSLAKDFLRTLALSNINVIHHDESDMKAALKALVNYQSTELTFQEALMAVLANRRGISQICTFSYLHPLFGQSLFYLPI
jgi:predicted nucleic acid-binding protein